MTSAIHVVPLRCVPASRIASAVLPPASMKAPAIRRRRFAATGLARRHAGIRAFEARHRAVAVDLVEPEELEHFESAFRALRTDLIHPARDDALAGHDRRIGLRHFRRTPDRLENTIVPWLVQEGEEPLALFARLLREVLVECDVDLAGLELTKRHVVVDAPHEDALLELFRFLGLDDVLLERTEMVRHQLLLFEERIEEHHVAALDPRV